MKGDVFQFSTLPDALGDADTVIVATGASDRMDPLGPFNVDFQVCVCDSRMYVKGIKWSADPSLDQRLNC